MNCICQLIDFEPNFEDGLILDYNGTKLECFFSHSPFILEKGEKYEVIFEVEYFNEKMSIMQSNEKKKKLKKLTTSFSYKCVGTLLENTIHSIIPITEEDFVDLKYLQGKIVELYIERLNVVFIQKILPYGL